MNSTPADIKRLMAYAPAMNSEFIVSYFGTLSRETSIDVMKEMLGKNMRQNLQMVVQVRPLLLSYPYLVRPSRGVLSVILYLI